MTKKIYEIHNRTRKVKAYLSACDEAHAMNLTRWWQDNCSIREVRKGETGVLVFNVDKNGRTRIT